MQWEESGERVGFLGSHRGGPILDIQHPCAGEKATTEAAFAEVTQERRLK